MIVILSNTCVGSFLTKFILQSQYNNPLMGSLILDDLKYIKFCNNLQNYIEYDPVLIEPSDNSVYALQTKSKWFLHNEFKNYPVILWNDMEIHFIHSDNPDKCLERFYVRLDRFRQSIDNNIKIFSLLSYTELVNIHDDPQSVIDEFLLPNELTYKVFTGPPEFKKDHGDNYVVNQKWTNFPQCRRDSGLYVWWDQNEAIESFRTYLVNLHYSNVVKLPAYGPTIN